MRELEEYIEEVGQFYERYGLPKMAGRILGFLMASPQEHLSFDSILEQLQASKGSISGNLKLLLTQKLIEKYMLPGNRKSHFRFSSRNIFKMLEDKISNAQSITSLYSKANDINDPESKKHVQLADVIDFYQFLEAEIPILKQKWILKKKRENQS
jgi:DNA-binding transcriptional regulator GbsR (MarR family)